MSENNQIPEDVRSRYQTLLTAGFDSFNRLHANISNMRSNAGTSFGIVLSFMSIAFAIIAWLMNAGLVMGVVDKALLVAFGVFGLSSLVLAFITYWPEKYAVTKVFEGKRFRELLEMPEEHLMSDMLYHLRESYLHNSKKYRFRVTLAIIGLSSFGVGGVLYVIFLLLQIVKSATGG